jgi:hypothetical protein
MVEALSHELASLRASQEKTLGELASLRRDYETLVDATRALTEDRETLLRRVAELEAANHRLVDMLWGRRSERRHDSPDQRQLNFGEDPAEPASADPQRIHLRSPPRRMDRIRGCHAARDRTLATRGVRADCGD